MLLRYCLNIDSVEYFARGPFSSNIDDESFDPARWITHTIEMTVNVLPGYDRIAMVDFLIGQILDRTAGDDEFLERMIERMMTALKEREDHARRQIT